MWVIVGESRLLIAVVGGKLQGVEAAYLARKAGWEVRVVDKKTRVPAAVLGHSFAQVDVTVEKNLAGVFSDVDFIIPALEDEDALTGLTRWSRRMAIPLAYDPQAYAISSSKLKSAEFFNEIGTPVPVPWPECGFPVVAKPAQGSGSKGVRIFNDLNSMKDWFSPDFLPPGWVLEAFVEGSQHSLEVIGRPGNYRVLQVTDLYVDQNYDCKRVIAPTDLSPGLTADFEKLSLTLAEALKLHGIMDVEVIFHQGKFTVLEIDARLPSQTPTAVYWSTNQNMVELLGDLYAAPKGEVASSRRIARGTVYEHIYVSRDILSISGEHIMTEGGPLHLQSNFFGADEAITNFEPGKDPWVATLIFSGTNRHRARDKRNHSISEIARLFEIKEIIDPQPLLDPEISGPLY